MPESAFDVYVRLAEMHEGRQNWRFAYIAWLEAANEAPDVETQEHCLSFANMISDFM